MLPSEAALGDVLNYNNAPRAFLASAGMAAATIFGIATGERKDDTRKPAELALD